MDQQQEATSALQRICAVLDPFILEDTNTSLLGGYTGVALFYAYYYQLTGNEEHLDKVHHIIEKCLQALSEEPMNGSHCSGIAGVSWCIQHLGTMGFIEADDTDDTFADIDLLVADFMASELAEGRNDFLHHGLGTALYFLERLPAATAVTQLENLVAHLEKSAISLPGGIAWKDHFSSRSQEHPDEDLFNLGLAHGVPAIISVLARCYEKGIAKERSRRLIDQSVQWLLRTKNNAAEATHSRYPTIVNAANKVMGDAHSRLGWCYGDLGIALTLQGAGKRLNRTDYQEEAQQLFKHIATHRNVKNGAVHDGCLCHGSAGIAHILQQAGLAAGGDAALLNASRYWLQNTLQMNTWDDGPAGYKFYHHPDYINSHNVLEGIAGIGLSLISFADTSIKPAWGECMLID
ncbi:lanthionine synthetase C family protein [Chitinophaga ginsengisegetis]|uniref:lanthionine synthetase C family protein n=1 Tax=Chitinophaga ginsengisegetis TaxID=393003 RepID=UPI000DBFFB85|nr:lanthionine synthetase C family protein [Chitinophaga ginsengisegetis]MDR6570039.1 lantibiotic modifying enzyme [Chitinophaga ginsengisegetis]MDR6649773.1 lantibiotic modifying enzyme [Chitinophaga ginsengisegetis]MDR6656024.1 lantibiotic modifying enzyme [Chitinophaga ginsengisegetis]